MGMALSDEKLDDLAREVADGTGRNILVNGLDLAQLLEDLAEERAIAVEMGTAAASMTKELALLRDALAGTTRELAPGTSLEDQLHSVHDNLVAIRQLVLEERLRSCVLVWQEGKAVVIQVKAVSVAAAPAALIVPG